MNTEELADSKALLPTLTDDQLREALDHVRAQEEDLAIRSDRYNILAGAIYREMSDRAVARYNHAATKPETEGGQA